ncbi:cupin domain-containing protein [Nocardia sp. CA2R105]|uniref:cupin domain-containing protein n=1 Tax=Nocardia coffeae TaxID=2873381 RepID=UPI001CA74C4A|nr:cupin domain-containing protein [Nocardia coffeae]MBY8863363.1 cupin domain-containing protein [Nocardia coffeae]
MTSDKGKRTPVGMRVVSRQDWGEDLGLVQGGVWQEMVGPSLGAKCRSLYNLEFGPDSTTNALAHTGEAVYYMNSGTVTVTEHLVYDDISHDLGEGAMLHVKPGTSYTLSSTTGARVVGGPSPVDPSLGVRTPDRHSTRGITLRHRDIAGMKVPFISRDARLVVWLGDGAITANMNYVVLEPGERNREHVHAYSEDTIHILEGHATAENVTTGEKFLVGPGDTIHIEIGFWHAVAADQGERVVSVGGPCPADLDMLRAAGADVEALAPGLTLP